jgi:hypothetical protein
MQARIELIYVNGYRQHQLLSAGRYRIGRENADISMNDPNMSTWHAELVVEPGRTMIADLGSTNGTFGPDGQRLSQPCTLYPGQTVRIGGSALTLIEPLRVTSGTQAVPQFVPVSNAIATVPPSPAAYTAATSAGAAPRHSQPSNTCPFCQSVLRPGADVCSGCQAEQGYSVLNGAVAGRVRTMAEGVAAGMFFLALMVLSIYFKAGWLAMFAAVFLLPLALSGYRIARGPRWFRRSLR